MPCLFSSASSVSRSAPSTTGRWNSDPAVERTVLGLYKSTLEAVSTTASAPAESAARRIVPALPGSLTSTITATSRGPSASICSRGTSMNEQTAITPWGVTVEDMAARTSSVTGRSAGLPANSGCLSRQPSVANRSSTTGGPPAAVRSVCSARASRTACGPSARNRPCFKRDGRPARRATSFTRSARGLDISARGRPSVFMDLEAAAGRNRPSP